MKESLKGNGIVFILRKYTMEWVSWMTFWGICWEPSFILLFMDPFSSIDVELFRGKQSFKALGMYDRMHVPTA